MRSLAVRAVFISFGLAIPTAAALADPPAKRDIPIENHYLNLPVKTGAPKKRMRYILNGKTAREFEIELADAAPSFWVFDDVSEFKGKHLRLEVDGAAADCKGLAAVAQSDAIKGGEDLYKEKHRPQFHFTSRPRLAQ